MAGKHMHIEEMDDGTYMDHCGGASKDGEMGERKGHTHKNIHELKRHVHEHFEGGGAESKERKEPKLSELNRKFDGVVHKKEKK